MTISAARVLGRASSTTAQLILEMETILLTPSKEDSDSSRKTLTILEGEES